MAAPKFGKLYEVVGDSVIASDLTANALRLFIWATRYFKSGERLIGIEREALESWMAENAPGRDAKAVQVVQFSHRQAAEVFRGSRTESGRQIKRLVDSGILKPIGEPSRGHCRLYVVCPNLHTPECVRKGGGDLHTPECVRVNNADLHTLEPESAHIEGVICTHAEPLTCDNVAYPDIIQINNPGGAVLSARKRADEPPPIICPACGSSEYVQITDIGLATCSCGTAWRV